MTFDEIAHQDAGGTSLAKRAARYDWVRRASVATGAIALFLVFPVLTPTFTSPAIWLTSCCNPRSML